jgi:hypothetical protein
MLMDLAGVRGQSNAAVADKFSVGEVPKRFEGECVRDIRIAEP